MDPTTGYKFLQNMEVGEMDGDSLWLDNGSLTSQPELQGAPASTSHTVQYILDRYITTTICAFGCLGNIVNLLVLTRARYLKSEGVNETGAHVGLVTLAVSDMLFCIALFPRGLLDDKISLFSSKSFWLYYQCYGTGLVTTFILTSTWVTVTMATLRYIGICHPLRSRNFDGPFFAKVAYTVVFIVCVLFNLPMFWQYKITDYMYHQSTKHYLIDIGYMDTSKKYGQAFQWLRMIFAIIIPAAVLIFCNCSLVRALRKSYRMRRKCYVKDTGNRSRNRITLTLIIIVTAFVLLVFPSELMDMKFFWECIKEDAGKTEVFLLMRSIANVLQVINFSLNFVLYCVINVHFRSTIKDMVMCAQTQAMMRLRAEEHSYRLSPTRKLSTERYTSVRSSTTLV